MAYRTTKFRDLRAKHAFGKSFVRLPVYIQKEIVTSERKLKRLAKIGRSR